MYMQMLTRFFFLCCGVVGLGNLLYAQHAYEASWRAGLMAVDQNPAAIVAAPHRGEFLLGSLNLSAQNEGFETNELSIFAPPMLLRNLSNSLDSLTFLSHIQQAGYRPTASDEWSAHSYARAQGPSALWRLKTNPDLVERGLTRRVFSFRLERLESVQIQGVDAGLAQAYAQNFGGAQLLSTQVSGESFSLQVREWDALALDFGISLGRGNHLFHLAGGAKALSAGSFLDVRMYGSEWEFGDNNDLILAADSVVLAYNPSYAAAAAPGGQRRFNNYEHSWGIAGEVGIIYQRMNYEREPSLEIGASAQGLGRIQYWNLQHHRYTVPSQTISLGLLQAPLGVEALQTELAKVANQEETRADGVTESLPIRLTAHGKIRLRKALGIQARADLVQFQAGGDWQTRYRATLCIEKEKTGFYFPLSSGQDWNPQLGFLFSWGDVLIVGSNDVLSNLFASITRAGVRQSHIFAGLHFPIKKDF
jgi:hypothetical protein